MDRFGSDLVFEEEFYDFIGTMLGACEDEGGFDGFFFEEIEKEIWFVGFINMVHFLCDDVDR